MRDRPLVFGIGLNKTGTRSLHDALVVLGWTPLHWGGPGSRIAVGTAELQGVPLLTHLPGDFPNLAAWIDRMAALPLG